MASRDGDKRDLHPQTLEPRLNQESLTISVTYGLRVVSPGFSRALKLLQIARIEDAIQNISCTGVFCFCGTRLLSLPQIGAKLSESRCSASSRGTFFSRAHFDQ